MSRQFQRAVPRFAHEAMGTIFEISVAGAEEKYAGQAARAAFQEIDRLETLFSRFNPCSEVSLINRLKPGKSMAIGFETYECLKAAALISTETAGAFDVNFRSPAKLKAYEVFPARSGFVIEIQKSPEGDVLKSVDLDLGGIGKGYALDKAWAVLSDWGIERVLLHSGTSTALAVGSAPGRRPGEEGWPVGVGGGWTLPGIPERVSLEERAMSGSGTEVKGRHILDPRTGRPARGALAAWVSHPTGIVSDALSTAFMVMRPEEVEAYCRAHSEVWALLIVDGRTCQIFNRGIFEPRP
jgi:thiamine biosynthesis lipoprotein